MKIYLVPLTSLAIALGCASAMAVDYAADNAKLPPPAQGQSSPKADNTGINERDRGDATNTPEDQPNRANDRNLLANVRRAVVRDKSLSSMAHNAKIIVKNGIVTLRGPVKNDDEKMKVESLAQKVKGVTKVDNQLDIKTKTQAPDNASMR